MIIGHQKIWHFFKKSAELNKLSHAYLFSGVEKLGKKTLAIEFVKDLFKTDKIKEGHPDFIFVAPIKKEIQISQIRDLIWRLSFKSLICPFKIAIIDQAHCLNQESQSALLKILEEPRGKTIIILISEYSEFLFPTILSRLQKIKFYPVKKEEIENYLKIQNINQDKTQDILEISQGRPGVAVDLIKEPQRLKEINERREELKKIVSSPLALRFLYIKDLLQKECDLKEFLELWLSFFRQELISFLQNKKERSFLRNDYSLEKLKNILWQIQDVNFLLSRTNINSRLVLEKLVMEI
ncbi:MAG: hypothetical protein AAB565_00810 [Patescibacteria group bacterium]